LRLRALTGRILPISLFAGLPWYRSTCSQPLLPHHWAIALMASAAASLAQLVANGLLRPGPAASA
jgi:hypothetical protein